MGMEVLHESRDAVASTPPSCMLGRCKQSEITSARVSTPWEDFAVL